MATVAASDPIAQMLSRGSDRRSTRAWAEVLATVPLFKDLSQRHLRRIAGLAEMKRYGSGHAIVREGDRGDSCYIVLDGTVTVRPPGLARFGAAPGDFFGELALLDGAPRSATVEANSAVLAIRLGRRSFRTMLEQEPRVALAMLQALAARLRAAGADGSQ